MPSSNCQLDAMTVVEFDRTTLLSDVDPTVNAQRRFVRYEGVEQGVEVIAEAGQ